MSSLYPTTVSDITQLRYQTAVERGLTDMITVEFSSEFEIGRYIELLVFDQNFSIFHIALVSRKVCQFGNHEFYLIPLYVRIRL